VLLQHTVLSCMHFEGAVQRLRVQLAEHCAIHMHRIMHFDVHLPLHIKQQVVQHAKIMKENRVEYKSFKEKDLRACTSKHCW
jgi:hypothetical protein